ncbi:coxsackievirus and adenovirus receptor homolog [Betta splendens]|uniref:Coxsackievirus and adenovirus receptor homolog n=1 Tax=Betta splendens TaxID=158456 RepID=A0A6P7N3L5_BETSP|nr:coxsackievirus and adenovirus receptor homolog [Betta splendens]
MAAVVLCWISLTFGFLGSASGVSEHVSTHSGDNVVLPCRAPKDAKLMVLEWNKSDHDKLEYVFLYREGQFDPENQHPSFKNRVELRDKQMKNGDMSLILINVTSKDMGTYECRVVQRGLRSNLPTDPINVINLEVTNIGQDFGPEVQKTITGGQRDEKVQEHAGLMLCQFVFLLNLLL